MPRTYVSAIGRVERKPYVGHVHAPRHNHRREARLYGYGARPCTAAYVRAEQAAQIDLAEFTLAHEEDLTHEAPMGMECQDCYRTDVPVYVHGSLTRDFRPYLLCRACAEDLAWAFRYDDGDYVARTCACCSWDSWEDAYHARAKVRDTAMNG